MITTGKGKRKNLVGTSAAFVACAAAGAYTASSEIVLGEARRLTLWIGVDPAAVGNIISLIPILAGEPMNAVVGAVDNVWFPAGVWDGTVTPGQLTAGSLPAGQDFTVAPNFARALHRQLDIRTEPAINATDLQLLTVHLDVSYATKARILYAEAGVVGTPASIWLSYSLSQG